MVPQTAFKSTFDQQKEKQKDMAEEKRLSSELSESVPFFLFKVDMK